MTRDAKLYYLNHKDWKPLADKIEQHKNYDLKNLIVIFDIFSAYPKHHRYAILSLHEDIDKIVEDYGEDDIKEAAEDDLMRNELRNYHKDPVYGDKSRSVYLNKVS